jgi:hypothetical protein
MLWIVTLIISFALGKQIGLAKAVSSCKGARLSRPRKWSREQANLHRQDKSISVDCLGTRPVKRVLPLALREDLMPRVGGGSSKEPGSPARRQEEVPGGTRLRRTRDCAPLRPRPKGELLIAVKENRNRQFKPDSPGTGVNLLVSNGKAGSVSDETRLLAPLLPTPNLSADGANLARLPSDLQQVPRPGHLGTPKKRRNRKAPLVSPLPLEVTSLPDFKQVFPVKTGGPADGSVRGVASKGSVETGSTLETGETSISTASLPANRQTPRRKPRRRSKQEVRETGTEGKRVANPLPDVTEGVPS